ncbi:LysR substrate-binding domain-containing protein [Rhodopseudomonas palustris]|uniref:LysR substrate-binding domain-containing protein n=1 Tax=Rhodopseudomonas palustris TaxID=1076 RepID=UPI0021F36CCB|nr:LysR substrate-binding domain-containing protein [Rhodopseudomonas palustris]UYO56182.1 LysR family transcriptional regulator [Rhodopseudomonas palustris]
MIERGEPPLTSVRAFEAVARLGGATAAARELGVSPSAVSHQLAVLDDFMGQPLTRRQGRGLVLTDAGREYFRSVRAAFAVLRGATDQLREGSRSTKVRLGVIPLFARAWLFRHIQEFLDRNPDIDLSISYTHHRNYVSDSADLSVRFGEGSWKGYKAHRILSGAIAPYCSRAFLARHREAATDPKLLQNYALIHDQDFGGWQQWWDLHHIDGEPGTGLLVEDGNLALQAALDGLGIALLRPSLVDAFVDEGGLSRLFDHQIEDGRDYYLCHLVEQPLSEAEGRLVSWIIDRCRHSA